MYMAQALKFKTVKDIRAFLAKGGRPNAKSDFQKVLTKGAKPIDTKR